jgi:hypothetical protein
VQRLLLEISSIMVRKTCYHKGVDGDLGTRLIELDTRQLQNGVLAVTKCFLPTEGCAPIRI